MNDMLARRRRRPMVRRVLGWSGGLIVLALLAAAPIAYWRSSNSCEDRTIAAPVNPMKAVVYCDYGPADVLKIDTVDRPTLADDQILVRVRAASLNPLDWHYMRGTPYLMRLGTGLRKPKVIRLGVDFAGTVEAVGSQVTQFKPGDEVFGGKTGALAEYLAIRESGPVVRSGQTVLINGASGGVGTFAVQIAKALGASVTGVCSTRNVDLVRSLGADQVIDYTKANFTESQQRFDVVLDNVGNHSLSKSRGVLAPGGIYVMVGGSNESKWLGPLGRVVTMAVSSPFVSQSMGFFLANLNKADLTILGDLTRAGKVQPVIDRRYPMSEVAAAIRYLEEGRARGKVVITME